MSRENAKYCFDEYILKRWPDWKPNEQITSDWLFALGNYTEEEIKTAIWQYLEKYEKYGEPKMNRLIPLLKTQKVKHITENLKNNNSVVPAYAVVCVDLTGYIYPHGENAQPRYEYALNKSEKDTIDPDVLRRIAEIEQQKIQTQCGGIWQLIIYNNTHKDPTANMVWAYNMRCTQAGTGTDKHIHAFLGDVIVVYEDKTKAVDRILIKNEAADYRKYLERTRGGKWDIEII